MSLGDDARRLRQLADAVPIGMISAIGVQLETIGHAVADFLPDPELLEIIQRTLGDVEAVAASLSELRQTIQRAADHQIGQSSPAPDQQPAFTPAQQELPRPARHGETQGRWIAPDGSVVRLRNGEGPYYEAAIARARELGLTRGRPDAVPAIATHVEVQFAMRMAEQGIQQAEIEINRPVCGTTPRDQQRAYTCHRQLKHFLLPGQALTVKDGSAADGRRYVGEDRE